MEAAHRDSDFTESGTLVALAKAEIDMQVSTAKAFPRQVDKFQRTMRSWIGNPDIAEACIFSLPRAGKNIEGASVRFAELAVAAWGNCRVMARVVSVEQGTVSAQGVFHDLETNAATSDETQRSIKNSKGHRYPPDMIVVTGRAACAISRRNAALAGIPRAVWEPLYQEARQTVAGDQQSLPTKRAAAVEYLQKVGVTLPMVLATLGVASIDEITVDHIASLRAAARQIRRGESTIEQAFIDPSRPETAQPDAPVDPMDALSKAAKAAAPPPKPELTRSPQGPSQAPGAIQGSEGTRKA